MSDAVVQCIGVNRVYGAEDREVVALRDVDLSIPYGGFAAVVGRSGSGKTPLLNVMGGLDQASSGEVLLCGRPIGALSDDERTELWRHEVGFVFQSFALLPTLSAYDNVALPLRISGTAARDRDERVRHCLEVVGLEEWAEHRPYELSGGQQQRIAVARALVHSPRLVLADEPTGELDSETGREIFSVFGRLVSQEGVTVVAASHDPLVEQYATLVVRLSDGRVQQQE
jgi:ABC-type lipoprotein export system ATPase subunit